MSTRDEYDEIAEQVRADNYDEPSPEQFAAAFRAAQAAKSCATCEHVRPIPHFGPVTCRKLGIETQPLFFCSLWTKRDQ